MTYSSVPNESKTQIRDAGEILRNSNPNLSEFENARTLADKWRACHAYPLNTFNVTLRGHIKKFSGETIVAQRLKRMSTIIDKLKRYPNMQLTTMQDIGGIRAVLENTKDVYELYRTYKSNKKSKHILHNEKDYIVLPRDEDGYRSIHLIYKYNNSFAPNYDGLQIELQIRTKLQHIWATAVETMGTFLGQALKSRQGSKDWLDFFAVTSSAFAHIEGTKLVPRYSHLSKLDTFKLVAEYEKKLGAIDKMAGFVKAVDVISSQKKFKSKPGWHYQLIVLDSLNHKVMITPYTRAKFEEAVTEYAKIEERAEKEKLEPVLVAAGQLKDLQKAYPNFFLDIEGFANKVIEIIEISKT